MSKTFLEDIPEFLEIQRDSFLRILDKGLIEAFDKINPISPTSQCKYGLLFYPKEYVLILPENTITEAFLQGKTYGCKIYVPAVIYNNENSKNAWETKTTRKKRFRFLKAYGFPKTTGSRFLEDTLFAFKENISNLSVRNLISDSALIKKSKSSFYKCNRGGVLSYEFFLPLILNFLENKKTEVTNAQETKNSTKSKTTHSNFLSNNFVEKENRVLSLNQRRKKWQFYNSYISQKKKKDNVIFSSQNKKSDWVSSNTNTIEKEISDLFGHKNILRRKTKKGNSWPPINGMVMGVGGETSTSKASYKSNMDQTGATLSGPSNLRPSLSVLRPFEPPAISQEPDERAKLKKQTFLNSSFFKNYRLHQLLKKTISKNSGLVLRLETAQKKKTLTPRLKPNHTELSRQVNYIPKAIQQKSKLGFFYKVPMWLRGRGNSSLIQEAYNKFLLLETGLKNTKFQLQEEKEWSRCTLRTVSEGQYVGKTFSTPSLFSKKLIYSKKVEKTNLLENSFKLSNKPSLNNFSSKKLRPLSSKEWVCIGMLPLMTPRGHFIINGSHRIIISQMSRAPGLYYQTGEKMQATIVPSKGAWLRINVKASDTGEIKVWVRITPQRKMPYKIFIETYKYLENSKAIVGTGGSKFLNLVYKTLNSKIKHLDKHYAIGYVSGQITRTLFNPASYSLGSLGRKRLNERLGINDKNGYLTSKDISLIKDNLLKVLGGDVGKANPKDMVRWTKQLGSKTNSSNNFSADDIDHLENRRVRTCGELLQTEIETGMTRLKKAIVKQLDEYSNPDSSIFNTFKGLTTPLGKDLHPTVQLNTYADSASYLKDSSSLNHSREPLILVNRTTNITSMKNKNKKALSFLYSKDSPSHVLFTLYKQNKVNNNSILDKYENQNVLGLKKSLYILSTFNKSRILLTSKKPVYQHHKVGISLALFRLGLPKYGILYDIEKSKDKNRSTFFYNNEDYSQKDKLIKNPQNLSPSKIIGTKAFAGALREFFGSNPLSQYMDQTNPLAEITHKRRLSSLGPGGVDRASAGIAIRGIHPSHYGRICPIETPEGKNAGLVNSITMWARINPEGFLETPYFKVSGGSLMSQSTSLLPQWNFLSTKKESNQALKIVSSDLKITQSAFLPSIALPTRDGSERSFGRQKRDYIDFCGISPMQNISVATSLIPFLEHDDATRALMGSNMQRQAVPLLKATAPLIRTGLEGKVVGESGHALQASCSGIVSTATRTFVSVDSFDVTKKIGHDILTNYSPIYSLDDRSKSYPTPFSPDLRTTLDQRVTLGFDRNELRPKPKQKFIGNIKNLSFLKELDFSIQPFYILTDWPKNYKSQSSRFHQSFQDKKGQWSYVGRQPKFPKLALLRPFGKKLRFHPLAIAKEKLDQTKENQAMRSYDQAVNSSNQKIKYISTFLTFLEQSQKQTKKPKQFLKLNLLPNFNNKLVEIKKSKRFSYVLRSFGPLPFGSLIYKGGSPKYQTSDLEKKKTQLLTALQILRISKSPNILASTFPKNLWRECSKIKRHRKIHDLQQYTRSNQATVCVQRPAVKEGRWVQKGDLIGDCSASKNGVLALGQNIVVAYLPMEGFNFEDAIVVSDRLVHEELYTSIHVQRVEFDMDALVKKYIPRKIKVKKQKSAYKTNNQDWITFHNPHLYESEKQNLNPLGIIKVGSWVGPGDVLVSKVFPVERKIAPSRHLLAAVFQEKKTKILDTDDTSVRVPKGIHGRVINVKIVGAGKTASESLMQSCALMSSRQTKGLAKAFSINYVSSTPKEKPIVINSATTGTVETIDKKNINYNTKEHQNLVSYSRFSKKEEFPYHHDSEDICLSLEQQARKIRITKSLNRANFLNFTLNNLNTKTIIKEKNKDGYFINKQPKWQQSSVALGHGSTMEKRALLNNNILTKKSEGNENQANSPLLMKLSPINSQEYKITSLRIYIAERKKLQVGDKMSGRHGNKGIVSTILPREDMPYLPDGTPVDMVLNPLGIPSRMNVGQVFECLLGLAASICNKSIGHTPFDEMYGPEASRSLVYLFLYVSRLRSRADWIFQPNFPGKTLLFDGRTGTPFEQWVTVGRAYMLKLIHMVDEKIHARSIGPRSLVTQQPVKGRARGGGQRLGEMEIWALEGFGAAYILQEILTIKSDDIKGRENVETSIISATPLSSHIPETFRITLFELRCLCLNLELNQNF